MNWNEDLSNLILILAPTRWKVLEVHYLKGINDIFFNEFGFLESWQFETFIKNHGLFKPVIEGSQLILDSYCMITPDGRFYQDTGHQHHYSEPILKIGALKSFKQIKFSQEKFSSRKGIF